MTSKKAIRMAVYGPLLGLLMLYGLSATYAPVFHYRHCLGEDRIIEWLTVFGFLGASVTALAVVPFARRSGRWSAAYLAAFAVFFFLCAGEEISWGQRLFGFDTPESIAQINEQGEFNIHNLDLEHIHPKDVVSWFMKLFGIILPLVFLKRLRNPADSLRRYLSPPLLVPAYLIPECISLLKAPIDRCVALHCGRDAILLLGSAAEELMECYWALCVFLSLLFMRAAWRSSRSS